ncbi:MAG TPA: SDR family oxidoreductase [Galbitalea sp.]|jgi:NAD(P)-dependent dehydrogenase (short-subunit alcohol dehydrogenase family)
MTQDSRTIVVTGATGDAGRAVTTVLSEAGHTVVAVGSNAERLAEVTANAHFVCDLTDAAATADLGTRVHDEVAPVDGVVHLVGGWRGGNDAESWDWLEPRLLTSLRLVTLAFRDDLTASSAGRLVIVGSTSASKPTWSGANYAVLKASEEAWMQAVASGWRKAGTAAAITLAVRSVGDDGTSVDRLASAILPLWAGDAAALNGTRVDLS